MQFKEDIGQQVKSEPMDTYSYNQSSTKLPGTNGEHSRAMHIDKRHYFVHAKFENNERNILFKAGFLLF